jgi:uncharacterized membrane protein
MLTAFGIFRSGEGAGVAWPGRDVALLVLIVFVVLAWSRGLVELVRRSPTATLSIEASGP